MATFNELAGTTDYQRQSWRDSYNHGNAAGDVTGNVNRSLSEQRDKFQGATISGSSTQMGAIEYAQYLGRVGNQAGAVGGGMKFTGPDAVKGSGPGVGAVTTGNYEAMAPATGTQPGAPKAADLPKTTRIMIGGRYLTLDTKWSDGADGEDRWGDVGGSIYGLGVMINDGWSVAADFVSKETKRGRIIMDKASKAPKSKEPPLDIVGATIGTATQWWGDLTGAQNNWAPNGNRGGGTGTLTGGGF